MKDYREQLLKDLEILFIRNVESSKIQLLSSECIKILSNYEIMERCTDIVPVDNQNEKVLKRYSACLTISGKSKNTVYQYIRTCRKLFDMLNKPYTEITTSDVRFFLAMELERGVSNVTLENQRSNISAFFQWLTNEELIPRNPMAKIKPIKCKDEIKYPFSDVEIDALRSACRSKKERAIIELLLSTGIRVSELTSMKIQDINFTNLSVHVVNGKGNKERMTYTTSVSAKYLLEYIKSETNTTNDILFYNKNHKPLNSGGVRYILNVIAERANVTNVHPHRFRRTFATNLAKRGMDIQDIQVLLGHSTIDTTMEYVYMSAQKVQDSYRKYIV